MDRKPTEDPRIQELISRSQASRLHLRADYISLRRKLDVPLRVRDSLKKKPGIWLMGSAAVGIATSFIFKRKRRVKQKPKGFSSFSHSIFSLTLTAARPLLKVWLSKKVNDWASAAIARSQSSHSPYKLKTEPSQANARSPGP